MAGRRINIDEKIERAKEDVTKAKARYDAAVDELEKLMTRKREMQQKELMTAFANSSKSYEEIMKFLSE
ncbi:MAG: ErpK protein [Mobilibacterium timonense]|uniref:ErpK protein n=1 Tax=Mobilibacterium timonense TaxID=1871012 RepID=UPI002354B474|nr:ErpK protein [Mobilibacterium timonense]MBM6990217.1 ErpK protein [Mobilibacterium timonense]